MVTELYLDLTTDAASGARRMPQLNVVAAKEAPAMVKMYHFCFFVIRTFSSSVRLTKRTFSPAEILSRPVAELNENGKHILGRQKAAAEYRGHHLCESTGVRPTGKKTTQMASIRQLLTAYTKGSGLYCEANGFTRRLGEDLHTKRIYHRRQQPRSAKIAIIYPPAIMVVLANEKCSKHTCIRSILKR